MKRAALALSIVAFLSTPGVAHANSRFPESNHVFFAPSDSNLMLVRTTFGLLLSRDRGATWRWICEQAIPLSGNEDPMAAITPDGTMLVTTYLGLSISRDGACGWDVASGNLAKQAFIDLAANPNDPKDVFLFSSSFDRQDDGGTYFVSKIFETHDEGKTFDVLGVPLDASIYGFTLDVTKTDPDRIYVSGIRNPGASPTPVFLTSKTRGAAWTESAFSFENGERSLFIAGVDPTNADRVYVRTSNGTDKPSRLLLSDDGGGTWTTIFHAAGPLMGFALSADGSKIYIGGPRDGLLVATRPDAGAQFDFQKKSDLETQCLASASDGLWACSNEKSGFVVALSKDDGVTFEKKTHFCDIQGPLECPEATSTNLECPANWPLQKSQLGCGDIQIDGGPDVDAGTGESATAGEQFAPGGGAGCNCNTTKASPFAALASIGAAIAALAVVFRRARRGR